MKKPNQTLKELDVFIIRFYDRSPTLLFAADYDQAAEKAAERFGMFEVDNIAKVIQ